VAEEGGGGKCQVKVKNVTHTLRRTLMRPKRSSKDEKTGPKEENLYKYILHTLFSRYLSPFAAYLNGALAKKIAGFTWPRKSPAIIEFHFLCLRRCSIFGVFPGCKIYGLLLHLPRLLLLQNY